MGCAGWDMGWGPGGPIIHSKVLDHAKTIIIIIIPLMWPYHSLVWPHYSLFVAEAKHAIVTVRNCTQNTSIAWWTWPWPLELWILNNYYKR